MIRRLADRDAGFTLIEVVVTIVVSAILAVLLMQVMKGHLERSWWPMIKINEDLALTQVIENISADYRNLLLSDPTPLVTLQSRIRQGGDSVSGYWAGLPVRIVENKCLGDIHKDNDVSPGEQPNANAGTCIETDTLLKVTLAYDNQSLTDLFSR